MKGEGVLEEGIERERASLRIKKQRERTRLRQRKGVGGSSNDNLSLWRFIGRERISTYFVWHPLILDTKPDRAGDLLENEKMTSYSLFPMKD